MKVLEEVLIMTKGGPVSSTYTGLYYAYDQGIRAFNFPRALAASLVLVHFAYSMVAVSYQAHGAEMARDFEEARQEEEGDLSFLIGLFAIFPIFWSLVLSFQAKLLRPMSVSR